MHEYSLSYHDRKNIYYFVVILSGIISIPITLFVGSISSILNLSLMAPSGLVIFFLVFHLFDKYIWKLPFMYSLGIIKIPNLNGRWLATIKSSKSNNDIEARVTITQTYSKIKILLTTEQSRSESTMANIDIIDPNSFKLRYEYHAEFQKDENSEIKRHYGVTSLFLESENQEFDNNHKASYYTELNRSSLGTMYFARSK